MSKISERKIYTIHWKRERKLILGRKPPTPFAVSGRQKEIESLYKTRKGSVSDVRSVTEY